MKATTDNGGDGRRSRAGPLSDWQWLKGVLLLVVVAVGIGAIVQRVAGAPRFCATVTMLRAVEPVFRFPSAIDFYDAKLAPNLALLGEPETLHPVIEQLDLVAAYSEPGKPRTVDEVSSQLKKAMVVTEDPGTGVVWVSVFDRDAERATRIANRLAKVYAENHTRNLMRRWQEEFGARDAEAQRQKVLMDAASSEMKRWQAAAGIVDREPKREDGVLEGSDEAEALQAYREAKGRYLQAARAHEMPYRESMPAKMKYEGNGIVIYRLAEVPTEPDGSRRWWSWDL